MYSTDCSDIAYDYSIKKKWNINNKKAYIFVIEVDESNKLETFKYPSYKNLTRKDIPLERQFSKHMFVQSRGLEKNFYKKDHFGRIYRNKEVALISIFDEYVADEKLVTPRYLIEIEVEQNLDKINTLYNLVQNKF